MRRAAVPALLLALAPALAAAAPPGAAEEEVHIVLVLSRRPHGTEPERDRIRELEEEMLGRLEAARAGRLARDRWEGGTCEITLAGPDAGRAWAAVEAAVRAHRPRPGSYAVLPGAKGAAEERIPLGDPPPDAGAPTPPP